MHIGCMAVLGEKLMQVVADFTTVLDGSPITIGDNSNPNGWTAFFKTEGRSGNKKAYIILMVSEMSFTLNNQNAEVRLNNQKVGEILNTNLGKNPDWGMQTVSFDSDVLKDMGDNELTIFPVPNDNPTAGNSDDDFKLMEVICHFHRKV
jgi:hypothetical protein